MKYTIEDIRREYDRLDWIIGIDTSGINITISTRAVNRLGCCKFRREKNYGDGQSRLRPVEIRITDFVLDCEDQFWDTIRHEYAHAMVALIDGRNHKHDSTWKAACIQVGCDPSRCAKTDDELTQKIDESGRRRQYKWIMECGCCGRKWQYKSAGKFVRRVQTGKGDTLRCPCGESNFSVREIV